MNVQCTFYAQSDVLSPLYTNVCKNRGISERKEQKSIVRNQYNDSAQQRELISQQDLHTVKRNQLWDYIFCTLENVLLILELCTNCKKFNFK